MNKTSTTQSNSAHPNSAHPQHTPVQEPVDTMINARWVIPIEPAGVVLEHHSVALSGATIVACLPTAQALTLYPNAERIDRPNHVLMPGLVNTHTHAAMTLLRGAGDDLALMDWLQHRIWPLEGALVSDEFVFDGTLMACQEMLLSGTTCFQDMYFFPDAAARAVLASGMRATLGCTVLEFPTPWATDASTYIEKGLAVRDAFKGEALLQFALAPHAPYTVSDATFTRIGTLAQELDIEVHTHLHETNQEISDSLNQHGVRPIQRLAQLGLLGANLSAAHCVHLTAEDIDLLHTHGVKVAHCPASNLKLASGIAPVTALLNRGVTLGIGTDGAASNNRLDLLAETRLAALLAKGASGQATAFNAVQALTAATLGGAQTLGLGHKIGSIESGKLADLICLDLSAAYVQPVFDPFSAIVYSADAHCVSDVFIHGEQLVNQRRFTSHHLQQAQQRMAAKTAYWLERAKRVIHS